MSADGIQLRPRPSPSARRVDSHGLVNDRYFAQNCPEDITRGNRVVDELVYILDQSGFLCLDRRFYRLVLCIGCTGIRRASFVFGLVAA